MKESEELNIVTRELSAYGIKPQVEATEAGHVRVRWSVKGKHRTVICGQNKTDGRAALNNRALVRRWLREDGAARVEHKTSVAQKILALPEAANPLQDRIARLESEVECLLDIVADLAARVGQPITVNVLAPPPPPVAVEPKPAAPRKWTNARVVRVRKAP